MDNVLGQFDTPFGPLVATWARYRDGSTGVFLDTLDQEPFAVLSVCIVDEAAALADGEFFVKTWFENEPFVGLALASGLFEDTGRHSSRLGLSVPIWRIVRS